ncbi:MAG: cysteine hydrolase [Halobacteriovoraceae bacterium]|nr:cysteine hydrolase [Halobacteriovoraceae bacterium]
MTKTALILVDLQNDYFPGGAWELHETERAADNAARLLALFRARGDLVVHIRHENPSPEAPFFRAGTEGAEIHPTVAAEAREVVLTKHRPNSFYETGLLEMLQEAGVEAVTICGAMSQMCVDATVRAAADHGFAVTVPEDACAARGVEFGGVTLSGAQVHVAFMAPLAMAYAKVVKVADLIG